MEPGYVEGTFRITQPETRWLQEIPTSTVDSHISGNSLS